MVALEDRRQGRRAGSGTPDGAFVFGQFVPDPTMFDRGQRVEALAVTEDSATLESDGTTRQPRWFNARESLSTHRMFPCRSG
jgi:hypothetical protein